MLSERTKRILLVVYAFVSVSLASGVIYGWPALRLELQRVEGNVLTEKDLGFAYTMGTWSVTGGRFVTGLLRDRFLGTRIVASLCLLASALGFLGIAIYDPTKEQTTRSMLSLGLVAMGFGSGITSCVYPIASLFPKASASIFVSLAGAFHVSALFFWALTMSDTYQVNFAAFAGVILFLAFTALLLLPQGNTFSGNAIEERRGRNDREASAQVEANNGTNEEQQHPIMSIAPPPSPTAWEQMCSTEYLLLLMWFSVLATPLHYFIGILGWELERKGDDDGFYTDLYLYLYAGSAVLTPVLGSLADHLGVALVEGLATLLAATALLVLASAQSLQVLTIALFCHATGLLFDYGIYYAHLGTRFGYSNYGTLTGIGLLVSSLISLVQLPLMMISIQGYSKAVNLMSGLAILATLPYCYWLYRKERREGRIMTATTRERTQNEGLAPC